MKIFFLDFLLSVCSLVASIALTKSANVFLSMDKAIFLYYVVCIFVAFVSFRFYRFSWRYVSLRDAFFIAGATVALNGIFAFGTLVLERFNYGLSPLKAIIINIVFLPTCLMVPRFLYRYSQERRVKGSSNSQPTFVLGSLSTIDLFLRYNKTVEKPYHVVGLIVDHNKSKDGYIQGHKVLGCLENVEKIITSFRFSDPLLVIADPKIRGASLNAIFEKLPQLEILCMVDVQPIKANHLNLRPIRIEDLLGRPPKKLDIKTLSNMVHKKTVLVTGAGGSIGSEIVRQIAKLGPKRIILLDHSEYALYKIDSELREFFSDLKWHCVLASVCSKHDLDHVQRQFSPQLVFHAAAIKHVPLGEENIRATFETNVLGTYRVAQMAKESQAEAMMVISTDKAVQPSNAMGLSKRLAEFVCRLFDEDVDTKTRYASVRFGNVLGSTGSVVPLFEEQIKKGGPVTVTHTEMERYFMTIQEAVSLVLWSTSLLSTRKKPIDGSFVLDMGVPVKIWDLAEKMVTLSGLTPYKDIAIVESFIRSGEKLTEELSYPEEVFHHQVAPGINFAQSPDQFRLDDQQLKDFVKDIEHHSLSEDAILEKARQINSFFEE